MLEWSTLVLDIKQHIANFNIDAWYHLYRYDPEFRAYAQTMNGIKCYKINLINTSLEISNNVKCSNMLQYRILFKRVYHSKIIEICYHGPFDTFINGHNDNHLFADRGIICYLNNNKIHREDDFGELLPAMIHTDGTIEYYMRGLLHRNPDKYGNDQPTFIGSNGTVKYFNRGKLHRENDMPAIIHKSGAKEYYNNGRLHRECNVDGESQPALYFANGEQHYYYSGYLHRKNDKNGKSLPAIEQPDGTKYYYKNGIIQ